MRCHAKATIEKTNRESFSALEIPKRRKNVTIFNLVRGVRQSDGKRKRYKSIAEEDEQDYVETITKRNTPSLPASSGYAKTIVVGENIISQQSSTS